MQNREKILPPLLLIALFILFSCYQKRTQYSSINKMNDKIIAPQVTLLANLPDSNKPKIIFLEKAQKPKKIFIRNPPTVHSFFDSITHETISPKAQGNCFFTSFTTDQGLA